MSKKIKRKHGDGHCGVCRSSDGLDTRRCSVGCPCRAKMTTQPPGVEAMPAKWRLRGLTCGEEFGSEEEARKHLEFHNAAELLAQLLNEAEVVEGEDGPELVEDGDQLLSVTGCALASLLQNQGTLSAQIAKSLAIATGLISMTEA